MSEETIERLQRMADRAIHLPGEQPFVMSLDDGIALHEAIAALSTEPCEDAISRQSLKRQIQLTIEDAVLNGANDVADVFRRVIDFIDGEPPVKPVECVATITISEEQLEIIGKRVIDSLVDMHETGES